MLIAVFKRDHELETWLPIIHGLREKDYKVFNDSVKELCDYSIVLGGRFENPLCLSGKRILAYNEKEWRPYPGGWTSFYGPIVKEYYHDFIDLTPCETVEQAVGEIIGYIEDKCLTKTVN